MKTSEAQKRASKKYYLKHKEYYSKKANENTIKMRKERKEYKARIEKAIDYLQRDEFICTTEFWDVSNTYLYLLNILQGKDDE